MKVAVATADGQVSPHFGHAPGFTIAEITEDGITGVEYVENPGGNCQAIPMMLAGLGIKTAIVGGIGGGAVANLQNNGIDVIGSASGDVKKVLEAFSAGTIEKGDVGCDHHDHDEQGCGKH
jgi:predicted Fe-Mo cluster-binding NifX family protein